MCGNIASTFAVHDWKVIQLVDLGLSWDDAEKYVNMGMDWHDVATLLKNGCPIDLAVEIAMPV